MARTYGQMSGADSSEVNKREDHKRALYSKPKSLKIKNYPENYVEPLKDL